jgi:hypothetical protein
MLIVDINTLSSVCKLNFADEVVINSLFAKDCKNVVRILGAVSEFLTLNDLSALNDFLMKSESVRNEIFLFLKGFAVCNNNVLRLLDFLKANGTVNL